MADVHQTGKDDIYNVQMIARHWRGWTRLEDAQAYEELLTTKVLPGLKSIDGYRGGCVLRSDSEQESEFVVVNFFESLEAVRRFAGTDYQVPVFEPDARRLLLRAEPVANHYEVRADTRGGKPG
jgi:heme-degrading monooxygenase HmoA